MNMVAHAAILQRRFKKNTLHFSYFSCTQVFEWIYSSSVTMRDSRRMVRGTRTSGKPSPEFCGAEGQGRIW
jgi:hypothetical protein